MKKKTKKTYDKKTWPGDVQNPFKQFQQSKPNQFQARSQMGRRSSRGR